MGNIGVREAAGHTAVGELVILRQAQHKFGDLVIW